MLQFYLNYSKLIHRKNPRLIKLVEGFIGGLVIIDASAF